MVLEVCPLVAPPQSRLQQFMTGTTRIPVNGFEDLQGSVGPQRFTIEMAEDLRGLRKFGVQADPCSASLSLVLREHRESRRL